LFASSGGRAGIERVLVGAFARVKEVESEGLRNNTSIRKREVRAGSDLQRGKSVREWQAS